AEVCYDRLGCFSDQNPCRHITKTLGAQPWSPEMINTRFLPYTRQNPNTTSGWNLTASNLQLSDKPGRRVFITHGLSDNADGWVSNMCKAILEVEDINCIGVDWRKGSASILAYVEALNNIRVVGAEIAYLLKVLQENLMYPASAVHLIGHSLGAHASGEAGKRHSGIWRITGLDPARQFFEDTPEEVRLDSSDASFVDVIHTDTGPIGVGIKKPIGHFDFYPNGEGNMIGCPSKLSVITNINGLTCNHFRAFHYYTESVKNPGGFLAYPCENYNSFKSGACFPCPEGGCPSMGHFAHLSKGVTAKQQTFYLNTGSDISHLASWRYKVSVTLCGSGRFSGDFFVSLFATGGDTGEYEIESTNRSPGNTFSGFMDLGFELGTVNQVTCKWKPKFLNIFKVQFGAERIVVQSGKDGSSATFCTSGTVRENVLQTLKPC
ncbi:hypothetical protein GDO86_013690, partial [Hymenochirus boettgeri]